MADWNASLYLRFSDERTRPAQDLLAHVPLESAAVAYDLGCGPGNSTELLTTRFPDAAITGVDTSDDMLENARKRLPNARFVKADIATWNADEPADLIFANASLQWLRDHAHLFPRLMDQLKPGGVLAIQMPDNLEEQSHRLMRETAVEGPWAATLGDVVSIRARVLSVLDYYDLLTPHASRVDIWRTAYHHPLADAGEIVNWVRATGLRPFIDPLDEEQRKGFLAAYQAKIAKAYPPWPDGRVLLAFPRLFIVVQR